MKKAFTVLSILIIALNITVPVTWAVNRALSLDGNRDYMDCGNNISLDFRNAITVEAWIRSVHSREYRTILAKGYVKFPKGNPYGLRLERNTEGNSIFFETTTDNRWQHTSIEKARISDDVWYHIAGAYNGEKMKIYVNGVLADSIFQPGNILTLVNKIRLSV